MCTFLYTGELLAANPMPLVGRPKLAKPLPKALARSAVEALLETVAQDQGSQRQTDWAERDLTIILTALLAGVLSSRRTVSGMSSWDRISGRRSASRGGGWRT